jgi:peptidoglycan/xylan/chitin deacetylase (PgdA/CDA1 family)
MTRADRVSAVLAATGLPRLLGSPGPLIVMYHGLGGADGVDPGLFEAQLDLLAERRRVVSLAQTVAALGTPEARRLAAITFDDGYVDFAQHAMPALARRSLHATLFVPAGHLGGANAWDAGHAAERKILDASALRSLDPERVEIGAHGMTHRRLAGLARETLRTETHGARARLEEVCARPVRFFAYPYGQLDDFDAAAEAAVAAAGFEAACCTHFGRGSGPAERFRLRRVGIEATDTLAIAARKLDGAYDWSAAKERLGAFAIEVKRASRNEADRTRPSTGSRP